jgi:hypothetical protein
MVTLSSEKSLKGITAQAAGTSNVCFSNSENRTLAKKLQSHQHQRVYRGNRRVSCVEAMPGVRDNASTDQLDQHLDGENSREDVICDI